jgi:hypothetical protein
LPPGGPRWSTFLRKVDHQFATLRAYVVNPKFLPPGALSTRRPMAVDLPWEGRPPICFPASFSGQPSLRRSTKQKLPLPPAGPRWSTFLRKVNHQLASLQANVVDLPWAGCPKIRSSRSFCHLEAPGGGPSLGRSTWSICCQEALG